MVIKEGAITLKTVFLRYLLTLCFAFGLTLIFFAGIVALCFQEELLYPANYSETLARQAKSVLESASIITEDMIPAGSSYAIFNNNYDVLQSNLDSQDLIEAKEYAQGLYQNNGSIKNYYTIQRQDGVCVLQYYISLRYNSEFLQRHFLSVQTLLIIMFLCILIVAVFLTSTLYAQQLNKRLGVLISATNQIKSKDLDFEVSFSGIKEFDDVIYSLSEMKTELKNSLEQQWNLEQVKKEQISALAHDLKTPLTIIKGNAELLSDSTLDQGQQEYIEYISKNAQQIEEYIKTLMEISNSAKSLSFQVERVDLSSFIETIHDQIEALANTKGLKVEFVQNNIPTEVMICHTLIHRAIMNIVSNAVVYSPYNGNLGFEIKSIDNKLSFITTDSGKGFSSEDMKSATKQFYMGDFSRTSNIHYGIGLYIADSIVKLHGGRLHIVNSPLTGGAQVTLEIPI
ncbi:sensor histidine kinase [Paenibacillus monticola]|uniref:histidine kinase n=1 Tax=Paenibacillus monticola TaxID=2666075 RepID=A0A7X2H430_9BACL|nr:HAMP domain-containing sensor histidine kinase [Paenibacillus monticola]MRN53172.1 sensor histidine kinase [Paenibacillus monticola]